MAYMFDVSKQVIMQLVSITQIFEKDFPLQPYSVFYNKKCKLKNRLKF